MERRTAAALAAAAPVAALVLLSGCTGNGLTPGTASVVGDERITVAEVDELTQTQCDLLATAVQSGQAQPSSLAVEKQRSLSNLISVTLTEQFVESEGVQAPAEVRRFVVSQSLQSLSQVDAETLDRIRPLVERFAEGQADLAQVGAEAQGEELTPQNLDQLVQTGQQRLQEWQGSVEVTTDARFSPDAEGIPGGGDGSVSQAASGFARQAAGAGGEDGAGFASALPPAQRCGG